MNPAPTPRYIPALRFHALTRFYDALVARSTREREIKGALVEAALPAESVLDLGAGTGTLVAMLKERCPQARVAGVDIDPQILGIARQKLAARGLEVELREGNVLHPPFAPGSFDRVVSSLLFHHLTFEQKVEGLQAVRTLLRPDGELIVADWTSPANWLQRVRFYVIQLLDGFVTTRDHVAGRFPRALAEAGFVDIRETRRTRTPMGTLALFRARPRVEAGG